MRKFCLGTMFCLGLTVQAHAQTGFLLSWTEGDLNGDRVPERVLLVSPDSADPTNVKSRKKLVVLQRKGERYQSVFEWPIANGVVFTTKASERLLSPFADFWGLSYRPAKPGYKPSARLCFTPGSGEFVNLVFDGKKYQIQGSGD